MPSSSGLAEQVTSVPRVFHPVRGVRSRTEIRGGISVSQALGDLNKQRRLRRMRRVVIASADATKERLNAIGANYWNPFVLLTYRPGTSWDARHISDYLKAVRRYADEHRFSFRYQWVLELQPCGSPHYHVLFWLPYGTMLPMPDKSGMWNHGFSGIQAARRPVGYLVKYATKGENDLYALPKNCRLFGVGGGSDVEKLATHRAGLPMWLCDCLSSGSRARRVAHVGWVCRLTGEIFQSPFVVTWGRDDWGVVTVSITRKENAQ
jgi:hypothetical protein